MSLVDKLTQRMKRVSGDLLVMLDRNDEATVGAVVASLKAGSGTSRRNNLPPHRVGAKWLEEIRQQAVVRRGQDLLEQFDEGTIRARSTLSPMLTSSQIRARWGSATVVGRGGFGRLGSSSAVSALDEEGAVHRVMPRPSVGTHALYNRSSTSQKTRPQSAMEKRVSDLTEAVASGKSAMAAKRGRRGHKGRRRPMSASMLGLADRKVDGANNDRVLAMIRSRSDIFTSSSSTPLHVPAAVPMTNPRSSSKFGGRLPGHARFEALQRQGSVMLERLRKELRETRDDGIHTDGGNRLRDPAVGNSVQELGKLYSSLYEGVHGSLNLMLEHMDSEDITAHKKRSLESVREKKTATTTMIMRKNKKKKAKSKMRPRSSRGLRRRRSSSRQRPKSAVVLLGAGKSTKPELIDVEEDDADGASKQLLDDDDLSGIKDLRGVRRKGDRVHRRRPRTAGPTGIRDKPWQTGGERVRTERNICTPTKSNSVRREKRRDLQYQAAIDKYRQYEYEDKGPRVQNGRGEGVFNVYN